MNEEEPEQVQNLLEPDYEGLKTFQPVLNNFKDIFYGGNDEDPEVAGEEVIIEEESEEPSVVVQKKSKTTNKRRKVEKPTEDPEEAEPEAIVKIAVTQQGQRRQLDEQERRQLEPSVSSEGNHACGESKGSVPAGEARRA